MGYMNFNKVPATLLAKIEALDTDDVIVATVKKIKPSELASYAHLRIAKKDGAIVIPAPFVPDPLSGKYSRWNINGRVVTMRNLPKKERSWSIEAPSWGSPTETHTISFGKPCYQKRLIRPKGVTLSIALLGEASDGTIAIKVEVQQVLRKSSPDFHDELFYNLNILQENLHASDVVASDTTLEEFEASVKLTWQFLPAGTVDEVVAKMLAGKRPVSEPIIKEMKERVGILRLFGIKRWVTGSDGFLRYFGAQFEDGLVAFENIEYGNALYVMFENWADLSKRSRLDLLKGPRDGFIRIPHAGRWPDKLQRVIHDYRDFMQRKRAAE
jgi:hypothetical protein